jgi:hypothetical protein
MEPADLPLYRQIVGSLIHATKTRKEILFYVSCLSKAMHAPMKHDMENALRLLQYLKATPNRGITFQPFDLSKPIQLYAHVDASLGTHIESGKSHMLNQEVEEQWFLPSKGEMSVVFAAIPFLGNI